MGKVVGYFQGVLSMTIQVQMVMHSGMKSMKQQGPTNDWLT